MSRIVQRSALGFGCSGKTGKGIHWQVRREGRCGGGSPTLKTWSGLIAERTVLLIRCPVAVRLKTQHPAQIQNWDPQRVWSSRKKNTKHDLPILPILPTIFSSIPQMCVTPLTPLWAIFREIIYGVGVAHLWVSANKASKFPRRPRSRIFILVSSTRACLEFEVVRASPPRCRWAGTHSAKQAEGKLQRGGGGWFRQTGCRWVETPWILVPRGGSLNQEIYVRDIFIFPPFLCFLSFPPWKRRGV